MTKKQLRARLKAGEIMDNLFHYTVGDECMIFKADRFRSGEEIIYVPDIDLNDIPMDEAVQDDEKIDNILSCCYTGDDFVQECVNAGIDTRYAERLFMLCEWQHPSSILCEGWPDDNDSQEN